MAELTESAARELGLRIISPDRPGIRNSSLQPERKLLDWPPLLAELADQMGIGEFRILGDFRRRALRLRGGLGDAASGCARSRS